MSKINPRRVLRKPQVPTSTKAVVGTTLFDSRSPQTNGANGQPHGRCHLVLTVNGRAYVVRPVVATNGVKAFTLKDRITTD
jgi:hypothetical protein